MSSKPEIVRRWNETRARIALAPERMEQLPIELDQLAAAAEAVRSKVRFDVDPSDFRAALIANRPGAGP